MEAQTRGEEDRAALIEEMAEEDWEKRAVRSEMGQGHYNEPSAIAEAGLSCTVVCRVTTLCHWSSDGEEVTGAFRSQMFSAKRG